MTAALLLLIKASVFGMVLAIGMRARWADVLYLWHRPGLLIRSLLAMYVLVPLVAFALVKLLPMTLSTKAALLVLAASAGAPLLPRKLAKVGEGAYALSLVVISSFLATIVVPAWVALFAAHFGVASEIRVLEVAKIIAVSFFLPLVLGMAINKRLPILNTYLANRVLRIAEIILLLSILTLLALHWQVLLQVQLPGMLALITMLILAIALGHGLGGPFAEDRNVLAIACATRHLGVAIVMAADFPGVKTVVLLIAYILTSAMISALYLYGSSKRGH